MSPGRAGGGSAEYTLNLFDPAVQYDPYPAYREMRAIAPVLWNPLLDAWMVWRYDDVLSVLRDHESYSSAAMRERARQQAVSRGDEYVDNFGAPNMLNSDPPDHDRYRGIVARAFTPRAIAAQEPILGRVAQDLLGPLVSSGSCEIVSTVSSPLPILAIAAMLGVDRSDIESFRRWSDDFVTLGDFPTDEERRRSLDASVALRSYFDLEIARRRDGSKTGEDLLSRLVEANEGGVLSNAELLASCVLLLVAGNETTTNLITNMVLQLDRHPEQRERLSDDPSLIPGAVEETLRFDGPVHWTIRSATREVEISGQRVGEGEMIFVLVAAANRDPERFEDSDSYDVTRSSNHHLGFGHGIHSCLGSTLARLEARVAAEALLVAAPSYRVALADDALEYSRSNLRSPRRLPIERT